MGKVSFIVALLMLVLTAAPARAQESAPQVGVEERLGELVPLDGLSFIDEDGRTIPLKDLFDRPVLLTLVYYRCPGICTPLLQETARVVGQSDLEPGDDYRLLTISFDPEETASLANIKKLNMLAAIETREVPPDAWRFLTGDADNIRRLTDAVGFHYIRDETGVDFVHAARMIFLSPEGKIVRYLNGTRCNPADLKMAVVDASAGRARSFMQRVERLCYSYDPQGRAYVLKINRIILGVTLLFVLVFGGYLVSGKVVRGVRARVELPGGAS
ncbi:MAG: SCO family protein [bacterium]|nr:SCO family protein [bacterium]